LPTNNQPTNNGGDGLSNSFIAETTFTGVVAGSTAGLLVVNKELAKQNLINNMLKKPGVTRTGFTPLAAPKTLQFIGKYGGWGFTAYGAFDTNNQWRSNQISTPQMIANQISNGIGAVPYMGIGTAWSLGWNLGGSYGPSKWYGTDDTKWFK